MADYLYSRNEEVEQFAQGQTDRKQLFWRKYRHIGPGNTWQFHGNIKKLDIIIYIDNM